MKDRTAQTQMQFNKFTPSNVKGARAFLNGDRVNRKGAGNIKKGDRAIPISALTNAISDRAIKKGVCAIEKGDRTIMKGACANLNSAVAFRNSPRSIRNCSRPNSD